MKFRRRLCWFSKNRSHVEAQYRLSLRRQGFAPGNPLYDYFGRDLFHDGEVEFRRICLEKGQVVMVFRNVAAINIICRFYTSWGLETPGLRRSLFRTVVTFNGVQSLFANLGDVGHGGQYGYGEIQRVQDKYSLEMLLVIGAKRGTIRLVFKSLDVENIFPKIKRYVPGIRSMNGLLRLGIEQFSSAKPGATGRGTPKPWIGRG